VSFSKKTADNLRATEKFKVSTLDVLMEKNEHKKIDILKIDIEGFEYDVCDDFLNKSIFPKVVLIEFHHRFSGFSIKNTKETINQLKLFGYKIFYVSANGEEFGFIKKNNVAFK
jgi:hypothetical protein